MSFKKQFKEELIDKNVWHCLNDTQIESVASMGEQQLQLYLVSYRRELLIAYEKNHYTPIEWMQVSEQCIEDIDNFLAINCS